jgi:hypothetical protein
MPALSCQDGDENASYRMDRPRRPGRTWPVLVGCRDVQIGPHAQRRNQLGPRCSEVVGVSLNSSRYWEAPPPEKLQRAAAATANGILRASAGSQRRGQGCPNKSPGQGGTGLKVRSLPMQRQTHRQIPQSAAQRRGDSQRSIKSRRLFPRGNTTPRVASSRTARTTATTEGTDCTHIMLAPPDAVLSG